ncbi:helix-turn-helix domain-containing protein [Aliarcobacter butzleri]|uniref:helix-turn-helix domain-containing protein n=1 Tax=Aliarcobacter butzleri TaxID=28197 RepID=UPI001EDDA970|nr:helix-turn-helix domain-containing protein [Aliarcobacter butzleri]MCG3703767.1 helix-turn-helix domain-containing protein [Aliarcobacter butzleri]
MSNNITTIKPKYMRAKELSVYFSLPEPTIWLYVRQGKIESKKISKAITLFNVEEVEKSLFEKGET